MWLPADKPVLPVSVPTSLGARTVVDIGADTLDIQRLENPQANLHNCATRYGEQFVRSVFDKLDEKSKESCFEKINLSDNLIGDDGAKWLEAGLAHNESLKTLMLPRCGITPVGFKAIGNLVGNSPNIETLIMSSNISDEEGVKGEFCAGLAKNRSLKSLYLAVCRLGEKGLACVTQGPLRDHPTLEHISFEYNRLEVECAPYLSKMLATNQVLQYLDVCGNSLGPEGAEEIAKGLKENRGRLKKLGIAQNAIKLKGCETLTKFFLSPEGQNMDYMDIRHNRTGYHDWNYLVELMSDKMDPESGGWIFLFNGCTRQLFANGSF